MCREYVAAEVKSSYKELPPFGSVSAEGVPDRVGEGTVITFTVPPPVESG